MPAKGKHRRPRSNSITRGIVAAGAGGAVLALPLITATGANAAEKAAAPAAASASAVSEKATPQKKTSTKIYSVVSGDYLSKIAEEQNVRGGWQKLYEDNREVVGGNPSLILPGMELTIGAKASAPAKQAPAEQAPAKQAPAKQAKPAAEAPAAPKAEAAAPKAEAKAEESTSVNSASAAQSTGSGFTAPVSASVTTPYRAAGGSWSSGYHTGVDFAAASGTPVKAVVPAPSSPRAGGARRRNESSSSTTTAGTRSTPTCPRCPSPPARASAAARR